MKIKNSAFILIRNIKIKNAKKTTNATHNGAVIHNKCQSIDFQDDKHHDQST